jgi:hypothetical protein
VTFEPAAADSADSAYSAVSTMLWREREVLDRLQFALVTQQLVLRDGQIRWLASADAQVSQAVDGLRELALLRSIEVADLAERLGVSPDISLHDLAALAPEPWGDLLAEHRTALAERTAEITATTAENRRLLQAGSAAAQQTLSRADSATDPYRPFGRRPDTASGAIALDRLV